MLASPNMEAKSQHLSKRKLLKYALYSLKVEYLFFYAKSLRTKFKVGSSFLLNSTLNTSPKPRLQKVLPSRHQCHTWDSWHLGPCMKWQTLKRPKRALSAVTNDGGAHHRICPPKLFTSLPTRFGQRCLTSLPWCLPL